MTFGMVNLPKEEKEEEEEEKEEKEEEGEGGAEEEKHKHKEEKHKGPLLMQQYYQSTVKTLKTSFTS